MSELIPGVIVVRTPDPEPKSVLPFQRQEVRDERGSAKHPCERIAFVFAGIDQHAWADKLFERLQVLAEKRPTSVLVPLEWGHTSAGMLYVLQEKAGEPVTGPLRPADRALAWPLLAQAAEALAGLHRLSLAHGNVNPANVLIKTGTHEVRLQGAAWGPMLFWPGGWIDAAAIGYLPSVREGQAAAPSQRGDVYALGKVMGLLLGDQRGALSRRQRAVLDAMTAENPDERPADGVDLLKWMRQAERGDRRRHLVLPVLAAAALLIATLLVVWWLHATERRRADDLAAQLAAKTQQVRDAEGLLEERQRKLHEVRESNNNLEDQLRRLTGQPPVKKAGLSAQEVRTRAAFRWKELVADNETFDDLKGKIHSDRNLADEVKEALDAWRRELQNAPAEGYRIGLSGGKDGDRELTDAYLVRVAVNGQTALEFPYDNQRWQGRLTWKPDDEISVVLLGPKPWYYVRPTLAEQTFRGPAALWVLCRDRYVGTNKTWIELAVEPCPGPPPVQDLAKLLND